MITVGQITADSPLGRFLMEQAREADDIVEIGTGSGLGSTACLAASMRKSAILHTYEGDKDQYEVAKQNVARLAARVILHHGVLHRGILPYSHPHDSPQIREMWEHELKLSATAPLVAAPEHIDLLLLDGGEYTSFFDFGLLWHRSKVIVVDDCNPLRAVKNAGALRLMRHDPAFDLIRMELFDRNGWAAYRRRAA